MYVSPECYRYSNLHGAINYKYEIGNYKNFCVCAPDLLYRPRSAPHKDIKAVSTSRVEYAHMRRAGSFSHPALISKTYRVNS